MVVKRTLIGLLPIVLVATIAVVGCEDEPVGRSACSTGPAYTLETKFPSAGDQASTVPECVPRCGAKKAEGSGPYGLVWAIDALPTGACSYDGEACQMAAVRTRSCPSGETVRCNYTGYECRCEDGNWRCYAGLPGASACICVVPDAGADGG